MTRINIEFDEKKIEEIKKLMQLSGVSTQKELFNLSLNMAKWMLKQRKAGKAVGSLTPDERFTELDSPALDHAATSNVDI